MKTPYPLGNHRSGAKSHDLPVGKRRRLLACRLGLLVTFPIFAAFADGCASKSMGRSGTDSNTNWLKPCTPDDEGGGLTCLCGQGSRACGANADCASLPGGVCRPNVEHPSACGADSRSGTCAVACGSDGDCAKLGLTCVLGFCEDSGGGGQTASGGSGAAGFGGLSSAGGSPGIGGVAGFA